MSDKSGFTDADAVNVQKAFLDAWSNFHRLIYSDPTQTNSSEVNSDWPLQLMDSWNRLAGGTLPDNIQRLCSTLVNQSHVYNFIGDQLSALMDNYNGVDKTSKNWQRQLDGYFDALKSGFAAHGMTNIFQKILELPMDNIQRTLSSASVMPGDFLQGFKNNGLHATTEKYLSVPGIGYTRESQEQYLKGIRLRTDYQNALNDFNNAYSRVGVQAMEKLRQQMVRLGEEDKSITSLRQIYDLWVDANEQAYADFFYSEEYPRLYGALVNSLMHYKQHNQRTVNELLAAMNIPTQQGVNTVKEKQQDLRRGLQSVRQQLKQDNERLQRLTHQFELLRKEVKELSLSLTTGAAENIGDQLSAGGVANKKDVSAKPATAQSKKKVTKKASAKKTAKASAKKTAGQRTRSGKVSAGKTPKKSTDKRASERISK